MIENPFETIASEPPETEESEGAPASRGSGTHVYRCPYCKEIFGIEEYESLEVWYGVNTIKCPCGCNSYSWDDLHLEDAWQCKNGCFVHDRGVDPKHSSLKGYLCAGGFLHKNEEQAINCRSYAFLEDSK